MMRPPGFAGAAFGTNNTGDLRADKANRIIASRELGIPEAWAFVRQVHGTSVVEARQPGDLGEADAIYAQRSGLPIAVATADCVPVIVEAEHAVAVIHAGWRGAAAGVVPATLAALEAAGHKPRRAAIGPAIGPCCYEVGDDVIERFPEFATETTWGSRSVDIPGYVAAQLAGLDLWRSVECTYTSAGLYSWRRDQTKLRQVAVAWLPEE